MFEPSMIRGTHQLTFCVGGAQEDYDFHVRLLGLAAGTPQGFTIDEPEEESGTHMCIPPHWEDRRSEISQLEPIDTLEEVVG